MCAGRLMTSSSSPITLQSLTGSSTPTSPATKPKTEGPFGWRSCWTRCLPTSAWNSTSRRRWRTPPANDPRPPRPGSRRSPSARHAGGRCWSHRLTRAPSTSPGNWPPACRAGCSPGSTSRSARPSQPRDNSMFRYLPHIAAPCAPTPSNPNPRAGRWTTSLTSCTRAGGSSSPGARGRSSPKNSSTRGRTRSASITWARSSPPSPQPWAPPSDSTTPPQRHGHRGVRPRQPSRELGVTSSRSEGRLQVPGSPAPRCLGHVGSASWSELDNPAGRLHAALKAFHTHAIPNVSVQEAWSRALEVQGDDVWATLGEVATLLPRIERALIASDNADQLDAFRHWQALWAWPIFAPDRPFGNESTGLVDSGALQALSSMSSLLSRTASEGYVPNDEKVQSLRVKLDEAIERVLADDDLPADLRQILT